MKTAIYFIFAYVMLGLQVGISSFDAFRGAAPNLGLVAVLFIVLNTRRDSALIGAFTVGLIQDLLTLQQPGLYAFSYGIVAAIVVAIQRSIKPKHPATHFFLALIGGFITACILLLHSMIHPAAASVLHAGERVGSMRISPGIEFVRVILTAVVAPFLLVPANRFRDVFSFQSGRKSRGWW